MVSESWFKQLDSVLSNSFNNLKYDVREIYRLINEIKNILIEAEPKNVKERVAVIETSLQDHVATLKTLEVVVAELKTSIDEIKDFNNINNIGIEEISRNIGSLLIKNQRNLEKVSKSIEIVLKNDLERKKETRELRQALKNIEKEVKKKLKMVRITAKAPKTAKTASKKRNAKKGIKKSKSIKHSYNTERPRITSAQFEAKRKGDLNSEWLEISGKGDMTGYVLQDKKRKHTYKFPNAFLLDGAVKIHTGEGQDTEKQLYWGNKLPIWNDNSDVAALKNRKGVIVSKARSERVHDFKIIKGNDSVNITSVQFENPGADRNPNGEWVEISGTGKMSGWTLEDMERKHIYIFPAGFVLNGKVRVYSGKGQDTETKLFWGKSTTVWNDDYDVCTLRHKDGDVMSQAESKQVHNFEILK